MTGPATAIVWELWQLTRWSLAFRTAFLIAAGSILLSLSLFAAVDTVATLLLLITALISTMSALWTKKGVDGRSGFSFHLGYARPVSTWLLAGVPLAYVAAASRSPSSFSHSSMSRLLAIGPSASCSPSSPCWFRSGSASRRPSDCDARRGRPT